MLMWMKRKKKPSRCKTKLIENKNNINICEPMWNFRDYLTRLGPTGPHQRKLWPASMDSFPRSSALLMLVSRILFHVAILQTTTVFIWLVHVGFSPSGAAGLLILQPFFQKRTDFVSCFRRLRKKYAFLLLTCKIIHQINLNKKVITI